MNTPRPAVIVVDQDLIYKLAVQGMRMDDPQRLAHYMGVIGNAFGRRPRCLALVSEHDDRGIQAYQREGFEILQVNGDRSSSVQALERSLNDQLSSAPPGHVILVTGDAAFESYCTQAARCDARVTIWVPGGEIPASYSKPDYEARLLDEVVDPTDRARVMVWLDYENLHIGLEKSGIRFTPESLIRILKSQIADLGILAAIIAFADWGKLRRRSGLDIQEKLEMLGVETRYLIGLRGKNSADMEIADDIRTRIELKGQGAVDKVVIGSCDRDFRPTIETCKSKGKKVYILGLENQVSQLLASEANEVRYINQHLRRALLAEGLSTVAISPWDDMSRLTIHLISSYDRQQITWSSNELVIKGALDRYFTGNVMARAIQAGIVLKIGGETGEGQANGRLELNLEHPLVEALRYLIGWVTRRINYCLTSKGMPYVDTNYIEKGMYKDRVLKKLGIGRSRREVERWLKLLAQAGILTQKSQAHPMTPENTINSWWVNQ